MNIKQFTMILGVIFLAIGVLGFFPALVSAPHATDPNLAVDSIYGRLLGLFPVNVLHSLIHLAFGAWGLWASQNLTNSRTFCKANAIIYGILAVVGLIPGLNTFFGLVPLFGHDVWLHGLIAVATAYYGWVWEPGARVTPVRSSI